MAVAPFRIAVPDQDLDDLRAALARTRWPDQVEGAGWDYGTDLGYLQELAAFWADGFNWRAREEVLNSLPQFRAVLDAPGFERFGVHFVHQPGVGPAPLPLVLTHGWPSTHYEYHDVVGPLATPPPTAVIRPTHSMSSSRRSPATASPTSRASGE